MSDLLEGVPRMPPGLPWQDAPAVTARAAKLGRVPSAVTADGIPHADAAEPPKSLFKWRDSAEFLAGDYRPEWLVTKALVRNQPGVIAGPSKGMKTSLLVDLAVSLATGHDFLGEFNVPKRTKTAIVSGESGEHTLKETCLRVLRAKGLAAADVAGWLAWEFRLPTFSDLKVMLDFAGGLADLGAEVVLIDPIYLALGDVDPTNMFEMGGAFRVVAEVLLKAGVTPILVHHANRQLTVGDPMELQHLAYSGLDQFARQFMLLNRREKYASDGTHDLWLRVGGSAGHGGLWSLHIEEGALGEDFAGREWNVTLETAAEVQANRSSQREKKKDEATREKKRAAEAKVMRAIDDEVKAGQTAATTTRLKDLTGLNSIPLKETIERLIVGRLIEEVGFEKKVGNNATRRLTGFKRVDD